MIPQIRVHIHTYLDAVGMPAARGTSHVGKAVAAQGLCDWVGANGTAVVAAPWFVAPPTPESFEGCTCRCPLFASWVHLRARAPKRPHQPLRRAEPLSTIQRGQLVAVHCVLLALPRIGWTARTAVDALPLATALDLHPHPSHHPPSRMVAYLSVAPTDVWPAVEISISGGAAEDYRSPWESRYIDRYVHR